MLSSKKNSSFTLCVVRNSRGKVVHGQIDDMPGTIITICPSAFTLAHPDPAIFKKHRRTLLVSSALLSLVFDSPGVETMAVLVRLEPAGAATATVSVRVLDVP